MKRLCAIFLILGCVTGRAPAADAARPGAASAFAVASVLDNPRKVDLDVWGGTVNDAVSQIARQTGVMPIVSGNLTRSGAAKRRLYLQAQGLTFAQAVEWLAHALGCRYRVDGERVYLTTGYEWVTARKREYGVFIRNVETLVGSRSPADRQEKIARFQRFLDEMMKVVTLFDPQSDKFRGPRLEESLDPAVDDVKMQATIPAALKPLFESALRALEAPGEAIGAPEPQTLPDAERQLIETLSRTVVVAAYDRQPLKAVVADLRAQSGLNVGFDHSAMPAAGPAPTVTLRLGNVNVMEALTALARQLGLRGASMSPPGGVWLGRARRDWQLLPSRRVLWADDVEARCYSLGALRGQVDGEALAHWLRNNVQPGVWQDPLASVLYHAPSGNLLVIAPPATQQAVRAALSGAAAVKALRRQ